MLFSLINKVNSTPIVSLTKNQLIFFIVAVGLTLCSIVIVLTILAIEGLLSFLNTQNLSLTSPCSTYVIAKYNVLYKQIINSCNIALVVGLLLSIFLYIFVFIKWKGNITEIICCGDTQAKENKANQSPEKEKDKNITDETNTKDPLLNKKQVEKQGQKLKQTGKSPSENAFSLLGHNLNPKIQQKSIEQSFSMLYLTTSLLMLCLVVAFGTHSSFFIDWNSCSSFAITEFSLYILIGLEGTSLILLIIVWIGGLRLLVKFKEEKLEYEKKGNQIKKRQTQQDLNKVKQSSRPLLKQENQMEQSKQNFEQQTTGKKDDQFRVGSSDQGISSIKKQSKVQMMQLSNPPVIVQSNVSNELPKEVTSNSGADLPSTISSGQNINLQATQMPLVNLNGGKNTPLVPIKEEISEDKITENMLPNNSSNSQLVVANTNILPDSIGVGTIQAEYIQESSPLKRSKLSFSSCIYSIDQELPSSTLKRNVVGVKSQVIPEYTMKADSYDYPITQNNRLSHEGHNRNYQGQHLQKREEPQSFYQEPWSRQDSQNRFATNKRQDQSLLNEEDIQVTPSPHRKETRRLGRDGNQNFFKAVSKNKMNIRSNQVPLKEEVYSHYAQQNNESRFSSNQSPYESNGSVNYHQNIKKMIRRNQFGSEIEKVNYQPKPRFQSPNRSQVSESNHPSTNEKLKKDNKKLKKQKVGLNQENQELNKKMIEQTKHYLHSSNYNSVLHPNPNHVALVGPAPQISQIQTPISALTGRKKSVPFENIEAKTAINSPIAHLNLKSEQSPIKYKPQKFTNSHLPPIEIKEEPYSSNKEKTKDQVANLPRRNSEAQLTMTNQQYSQKKSKSPNIYNFKDKKAFAENLRNPSIQNKNSEAND